MRFTVLLLLAVGLAAGLVGAASAQQAAGASDPALNAQAYTKGLIKYMSSPDPRLRFSVREALRIMGPQAVSAINEAMATESDKHVKAFMARTVEVIKNANRDRTRAGQPGQPGQPGERGRTPFGGRNQDVDIDRVAMEVNLTWEQMDEVLPVLKKARKDAADLMAEFREAGGNFRDREAMRALQEEMSAIAKEAEPKLKKTLSEAQIQQLRRYLNPMGQRMMGMRGGRFGGEGGGRRRGGGEGGGGGGGGGGERPIR
jgi:hypothetical protein